MRRWALLAALLAACGPRVAPTPLPDGLPGNAAIVGVRPARDVLRDALTTGEPSERARAIAALITLEPSDATLRDRGLTDEDAWVQRAAVAALTRQIADPAVRTRLFAFVADLRGDPYVRAHAVATLLPSASEDERRALTTLVDVALSREHAAWRRTPLVWARARLGSPEAAAELVRRIAAADVALDLAFLADVPAGPDPALAAAFGAGAVAMEELALPFAAAQLALGDPAGEAALRKALDGDVGARLEVLDLAAALPPALTDALVRRAAGDADEVVAGYARVLLAARGVGDPADFERAAASPERDLRVEAVRWVAVADPALGKRGERIAKRLVRDALADPDAAVRTAAADVAASVLGPEDADRVRALLADDNPVVRVAGAAAAARMGL